ncbi:MAG: bifunctional folylpolyglutamate synthase/dihydrofolate synthase [Nitrospirae bacterium]|nr:bifunctional folylpolyglutamate synthase/dihydrofolate synthase [Nitrospirota bacterium]
MMSYTSAVSYLYDLQKHSIKLGLERTEKLLTALGEPQRRFRSVHVAGTNGKGSTAAMIASMLMADGFNVGLFTSPHMVSFTERVRINNVQISEADVVQLTEEIKEFAAGIAPQSGELTFFEFVTAMAFLYFARNNVDWAVVEVGMGGRLDATNLITPAVSVITAISYDHREFLGDTLADIASEKAGIIKTNVPVVCSSQEPVVEQIIRSKASLSSSALFLYGADFSGRLKSTGLTGTTFDYDDGDHIFADLYTPLAGEHQVINACLAVKAFLNCMSGPRRQTPDAVREGLAAVQWPGRLELVQGRPILLDGAHNPKAANALSEFIRKHLAKYRIILIAGIMADKDIAGILSPLLPLASDIIFTAPNYGRSAPPGLLSEHAASLGFQSKVASTISAAMSLAMDAAFAPQPGQQAPALIVITGSFFTVGEAKELLGEKAVLGDLREGYSR